MRRTFTLQLHPNPLRYCNGCMRRATAHPTALGCDHCMRQGWNARVGWGTLESGKPHIADDVDSPHEHQCPECGEWWVCTKALHDRPRSEPTPCECCR